MKNYNERFGSVVMTGSNVDIYRNYQNNFKREANNLSKLRFPHIVKVLELFDENNTSYFSMEYIDGENLDDYILSKGHLSERESLENMVQILEALSCMHNSKMLHLDLKPLNIMRSTGGDMILIDFGLSKQFDSNGEPESSTPIGLGTRGYAPIEQSACKKEDGYCPYMDIYALGGTLYKMLTGITPPDASTILNEGFPIDSMKNIGINKEIISLAQWAMEPMWKKRIQTATEFLNEIKRLLPLSSECQEIYGIGIESHDEPIVPICGGEEVYNGFCVRWNKNVIENKKDKIRELLKHMFCIGEKKQYEYTDYDATIEMSKDSVMSLGEDSWHYLYPILIGEHTDGYFPPKTIATALRAISYLSYLTGLPFRLSDEYEMISDLRTAYPHYWDSLRRLCFSRNKKLQYKHGLNPCLNDVKTFEELNTFEYDIQLVCDGLKPVYKDNFFDIPQTQDVVDEILPIGFGLYKVRLEEKWNIRSPHSPLSLYLPFDCNTISDINIHHVPGSGSFGGCDFLGVVATKNSTILYYSFEDGKFKLVDMLTEDEVERRKQ